MKIGSCWLAVITLAVVTAPTTALSDDAQPRPPVERSVGGISLPAPAPEAPPLGTILPNVSSATIPAPDDCMAHWDPAMQISKTEWRRTCDLVAAPPARSTSMPKVSSDAIIPPRGGETLANCMADWDPATHMSKAEWRRACERVRW
jgi:hypothetical protein